MIERAGPPSRAAPIASRASRLAAGPAPQLTPTASAPAAARACAAARGDVPSVRTRSSPKVSEAMTGRSEARARLLQRQEQLAQVGERLEHEGVDPALEQPFDLLPEGRPGSWLGDGPPAASRLAERSDGATHECVAPAHLAGVAGEGGRPPVEVDDPLRQAPGGEPRPVRAEREGLDQLRAGLQVLAVGAADQLGLGRHELLQAGPLGHAAAEQEGAHPAVDEQRPPREAVAEALAGRGDGWQAVLP